MKKFTFLSCWLIVFFLSAKNARCQHSDSCAVRISLLTGSPGTELYSSFGHSALRIFDTAAQTDIVFNYGTFDFNDPDFYWKFIRGNLPYFVSADLFSSFLEEYIYFKRGVTEQVLNLSCEKKKQMLTALYENAKEANKYYRYDFAYDNCTTRLRDLLERITEQPLQAKTILPTNFKTFRHLIHDYLNKGQQHWSMLGIDILLGYRLDKNINNREAMFLPGYLLMAFDSTAISNRHLVKEKKEILMPTTVQKTDSTILKPVVIFAMLFFLITLLSIVFRNSSILLFQIADFILFSLCGVLGLFLLFMWFSTNHLMTKNNFNLLWALPTHLPVSLFLFSKKNMDSYLF